MKTENTKTERQPLTDSLRFLLSEDAYYTWMYNDPMDVTFNPEDRTFNLDGLLELDHVNLWRLDYELATYFIKDEYEYNKQY